MHPPIEDHLAIYEKRLYDLESRLAEQNSQLEDVAKMGLMITSLLDLESVLAAMMEIAIRTVGAEVGCIVLEEQGSQFTRVSWGVDRETLRGVVVQDDIDIVDWAMKTGEISVLNRIPSAATAKFKIDSTIAAPLTSRDVPFGVLVVINKASGLLFTDEDKLRLQLLVRFASVAIENANLLRAKLQSQKLEQELELARAVQQTLLPPASARFERAVIEAVYVPAGHVGGDYFDIINICPNEFVVIVGDVSNKGVPAALMMAAARSVFRMETAQGLELGPMVSKLNTFLCDQVLHSKSMFISMVYAYFDLNRMTCTYVNAGHLPPVHYRSSTEDISEWRSGGTLVGQFPDFSYKSETIPLTRRDKILFYTDGLSESENDRGELFGRKRVQEFVLEHATVLPHVFTQSIMAKLTDFRDKNAANQIDDTTVLLVEIV